MTIYDPSWDPNQPTVQRRLYRFAIAAIEDDGAQAESIFEEIVSSSADQSEAFHAMTLLLWAAVNEWVIADGGNADRPAFVAKMRRWLARAADKDDRT